MRVVDFLVVETHETFQLKRVEEKSRLNEVALEQYKKLINNQAELSQTFQTTLEDMCPKLMSRHQDVDRELARMEKRSNRHWVALDKAEERIQALEEVMALQQAKMDSMLDKLCHCRTRSVRSYSSSLLLVRLMESL